MDKFQTFAGIMAFYAILSFVLFPYLFYTFGQKSYKYAGNGMIAGCIVSIALWYTVGSKMVA